MSKVLMADLTEGRAAKAAPVWSDGAFADIADRGADDRDRDSLLELADDFQHSFLTRTLRATAADTVSKDKTVRHRFGLPSGFVSRLRRYGRTMLFEDNVYRLPNGLEFIPQPPAGTLGSRNHQYALLTAEQYVESKRSSLYVRTDGRIFDYAFDHNVAEREMFDTGFTIHDLERTGRYAPELKPRSFSLRKIGKKRRVRRRK